MRRSGTGRIEAPARFEPDHTALALGLLIVATGLTSGVILNTILCSKLPKRFFRTAGDRLTIGFVSGADATVVCMLFIDPIIGWFVRFLVSIALPWLMVRYTTMDARFDRDSEAARNRRCPTFEVTFAEVVLVIAGVVLLAAVLPVLGPVIVGAVALVG